MKFAFERLPVDVLRTVCAHLNAQELIQLYWIAKNPFRRRAAVLELCKRCDKDSIYWQEKLFKTCKHNFSPLNFEPNQNNEHIRTKATFATELSHLILEAIKSPFSNMQHKLSALLFLSHVKGKTCVFPDNVVTFFFEQLQPSSPGEIDKFNDGQTPYFNEAQQTAEILRVYLTPEQIKKQINLAKATIKQACEKERPKALSILNVLEPYLDTNDVIEIVNICIEANRACNKNYIFWHYISALLFRVDEAQLDIIIALVIKSNAQNVPEEKKMVTIIINNMNQNARKIFFQKFIDQFVQNKNCQSSYYLLYLNRHLSVSQWETLFQELQTVSTDNIWTHPASEIWKICLTLANKNQIDQLVSYCLKLDSSSWITAFLVHIPEHDAVRNLRASKPFVKYYNEVCQIRDGAVSPYYLKLIFPHLDEEKKQALFSKIISGFFKYKDNAKKNIIDLLDVIGKYSQHLSKTNWILLTKTLIKFIDNPLFHDQYIIRNFIEKYVAHMPEILENQLVNMLIEKGKPSYSLFLLAHRVDDNKLRTILLMKYPLNEYMSPNALHPIRIFARKIKGCQIDIFLQWIDEAFLTIPDEKTMLLNLVVLSDLCANASVTQRTLILDQALKYMTSFGAPTDLKCTLFFGLTHAWLLNAIGTEKAAQFTTIMTQIKTLITLKIDHEIDFPLPIVEILSTLSLLIPAASAAQKASLNFNDFFLIADHTKFPHKQCVFYEKKLLTFCIDGVIQGLDLTEALKNHLKKPLYNLNAISYFLTNYIPKLYATNFTPALSEHCDNASEPRPFSKN